MKNEKINSQTEANKKWQESNREKTRYLRNRSTTRSFLKAMKYQDLKEMKLLIQKREKEINMMNYRVLKLHLDEEGYTIELNYDNCIAVGTMEEVKKEIIKDLNLNEKGVARVVYEIHEDVDSEESMERETLIEDYSFDLIEYRNLKNAAEYIKQQIDFEEFDEIQDTLDRYNVEVKSEEPNEILAELEDRVDNFIENVME